MLQTTRFPAKKASLILCSIAIFLACLQAAETQAVLRTGPLPASSRSAMESNSTAPFITADPAWYVWGASVIRDDHGVHHMFADRWPRKQAEGDRGMRGWLYVSQIARFTSLRPEGPYVYQETVIKGFGDPQPERWDARNAHNPYITRMKDPATGKRRYYLYYIANRDDDRMSKGRGIPKAKATDWWDRIITQRIGVAVADSPEGPWTRHPDPVIAPPNGPLRHYLVNPAVAQLPDGSFLMCLKGRSDEPNYGRMIHGWAVAERPEGPFVARDSLLFDKSILAEDPCLWVQGGYVHVAVKDWKGGVSGTPGISRVRARLGDGGGIPVDGLRWEIPDDTLISPKRVRWDDGNTTQLHALERPFILLDPQGIPSHLFTAACIRNPFASRDNLPFNLCQPLTTTTR